MTPHSTLGAVIGLAIAVGLAFKAKAIQAGVEWCWKKLWNWSQVTVEIREVCEDMLLASLEAEKYTVHLYIFLRVWVVNKKEVPTVPKEWTLAVVSGKQKLKAEPVPDFSKWHQHSKIATQRQGFHFVEDIREPARDFGKQPLQQGIPAEGWVCFVVRDTDDSLLQGATLRLTLIDSLGRKHPVKKTEPWHCKGNMVNPEQLW